MRRQTLRVLHSHLSQQSPTYLYAKYCYHRHLQTDASNISATLPELLSNRDLLHLQTLVEPLTSRLHSRHADLLSQPNLRPSEASNVRLLTPLSETLSAAAALRNELSDLQALQTEATATNDTELHTLAEEEKHELQSHLASHAATILSYLLSRASDETAPQRLNKAVILELRAGTGGDEAALFVTDLYEMYVRLCQRHKWRIRELSRSPSPRPNAFREIILRVSGLDAGRLLSAEAGVHRVQRVPETETQGRVHTSTASIAVLEDDANAARAVVISDSDIRVDVYRASGAGGQHVNKTESAVRITHIPTGLVATSQEDRSQHRNRAIALEALAARISAKQAAEAAQRRMGERRKQLGVSIGERSDRIRTYNFPQSRVTDHRVVLDEKLVDALPSLRDAIGNKNANLDGVLQGGSELDAVMRSVIRVRELAILQEVLREAREVGAEINASKVVA